MLLSHYWYYLSYCSKYAKNISIKLWLNLFKEEIFNYSPYLVRIPDGGCSPTGLSATFDDNVALSPGAQFITCYQEVLAPAGLIAARAGWPSENYTATNEGLTNATLHLVYGIVDDNNQTKLRQYDTEFQFTILPSRPFGGSPWPGFET